MSQPAPDSPQNLDASAVIDELGRVHVDLAALGAIALCAELAQHRVLSRVQARQLAQLREQVPPSVTEEATPGA